MVYKYALIFIIIHNYPHKDAVSEGFFITLQPEKERVCKPVTTRRPAIRMIVASQVVCSQEDLMIELDKAGFPCTQTTLSRDLKQLRISKVRGKSGHSAYALPHEGQFLVAPTREEQNKKRWSVRFSANIMVVHTPPGHASMVALEIDSAAHPFFLGSVAGDDTVLVVLNEEVEREDARSVILGIVPQLDKQNSSEENNG